MKVGQALTFEEHRLAGARHLAEVARTAFAPEDFARVDGPAATYGVRQYLQAARWEAGLAIDLLSRTTSYSPGGIWQLAQRLVMAVNAADRALGENQSEAIAQEFTAVALLWRQFRDRAVEIDNVRHDAQVASTAAGVAAAEAELRSLVEAGERPVGVRWREEAVKRHGIFKRSAKRVWDAVAREHPGLSSNQGKPKRRNP